LGLRPDAAQSPSRAILDAPSTATRAQRVASDPDHPSRRRLVLRAIATRAQQNRRKYFRGEISDGFPIAGLPGQVGDRPRKMPAIEHRECLAIAVSDR
jgi:hypothetical protein